MLINVDTTEMLEKCLSSCMLCGGTSGCCKCRSNVDKIEVLCIYVLSYAGKIRYGIKEINDILVIDDMYGQITLNKTIDKEIISHLSFTVQAFDSGGHVVST